MKDGAVDNIGSQASFLHVAAWLSGAAFGSRCAREAAKFWAASYWSAGWLKSSSVAEGVFDLVSHPASSVADGAEDAAAVDRVELRIGQLDIFRVRLFHVLHCSLLLFRLRCGGIVR